MLWSRPRILKSHGLYLLVHWQNSSNSVWITAPSTKLRSVTLVLPTDTSSWLVDYFALYLIHAYAKKWRNKYTSQLHSLHSRKRIWISITLPPPHPNTLHSTLCLRILVSQRTNNPHRGPTESEISWVPRDSLIQTPSWDQHRLAASPVENYVSASPAREALRYCQFFTN